MPKISVIIPVYNKEHEINATLESLLNQTFSDFEAILINDGSTDASARIISEINDARVKMFTKKNEGVSIARNFGVEKATADYIAFLDADDFWYPNHLEVLNKSITTFSEGNWFANAYKKKWNDNLSTVMNSPILKKGENWHGKINDFFKYCYVDSLTNSSAVCFKKEFFNSLNGFNELYSHGEDTDFWVRAALKSPLIFSNTITAIQNLDSTNRSSTIPASKRKTFNVNNFKDEEKTNSSLKKYLDLNRYSLAVQQKTNGNQPLFKKYKKQIDPKNLSRKQRFLLKQPTIVLKLLLRSKIMAEKYGVRLSSYKL